MESDAKYPSNGVATLSGIGRQSKDYKVGETIQLVVHGYGGFSAFFEEAVLSPSDRLIELEIKSVKAVKKQEFIEA